MACSAGSSPAAVTGSMSVVGSSSNAGQQQQHIVRLAVGGGIGFDLQNSSTSNIMASSLSPTDDIIKMGTLRKGKKGKKRWFVLHQETYGKPARLDCYESEKLYCKSRSSSNANVQPKLSVPMKQCFNINTRIDNKLKHCIALYTMDEVLLLGCDNEQEQEAWLQTLLTVLRNTKGGFGQDDSSRLNYDHVWDVNIVRDKGLTEKNPSLSGHYRLCMTHAAIFLYRKGEDVHSLEFPLVFIQSYGCKGNMWFLRVGRTAMTGSGELTMETEDPTIAVNINDTMKAILEENHDQRQRSTSIGDRRQGSAWGGRSGSTTAATMLSSSSSVAASSTSLERSGSIVNPQSRSRAISESEKTLQNILQKTGSISGSTSSIFKTAMTRKISAPPTGFIGDRYHGDQMAGGGSNQQQLAYGVGTCVSPKKAIRKMTTGSMSLRSHLSHPRGNGGVHPVDGASSAAGAVPPGSSSALSTGSSAAVSPVSPASTAGAMVGGLSSGRTSSYSPGTSHSQSQWMPPGQSPLATNNAFCSSDSVGSGSTTSELEHGVSRYLHRQAVSERAASMEVVGSAIAEESSGSGAEYLPMQAATSGGGDDVSKSTASSRASSTSTVLMSQRQQPQQSDRTSVPRGGDTYMDMSVGLASQDRRRMTADSGYLEMHRAANMTNQLPSSSSSDHVAGLAGYTPMGPASIGRSSSSAHSRQTSWHLEEVRSYISDSDNSSCSVPPSRAWSLGSRPSAGTDSTANAASYTAMGPASTMPGGMHTMTPTGPLGKFGLFWSSRLGGGSISAEDRKRAHSVGSWNKPPWKKNLAASSLASTDVPLAPASCGDPNAPSTSSSFYRPRSESFGSARSTPGSRRLMDSGGSKLSNQSEDLVEMEFGRSSIGRSPSGSLGSTESISRSRASSLGGGGTGATAGGGGNGGGVGGAPMMFGRQAWSPRVEQITEDNFCLTQTPGTRRFQISFGDEYVPMEPSDVKADSDYCAMTMGGSGRGESSAMIPRSQEGGDDYMPMAIEPKHGGRTSVSRQHSNPSNNCSTDTAASGESTASMPAKGPIRHGSGSSNLSLGNSNCMGLDSGVGGSSFSLDQQKSEAHSSHQHSQHPQQLAGIKSGSLASSETRARSSTNLSSMEQLKERLARVEMAGGAPDSRRSMGDEDAYMQMTIPQKSPPTGDPTVRRSSSFAKMGPLSRRNDLTSASQKSTAAAAPVGSQSPSAARSPIMKMFASFGKGSSKQQPQQAAVISTSTANLQHKSPTPSLKSIPSGSGGGDSRSRTPSASSKISLTDSATAIRQPQKPPAIVTNSSSIEAELEPAAQLEYASLDLQHHAGGNPSPTRKTPSPRPPSSCSIGGDTAMIIKFPSQAPAVLVNDGVVYAQIDAGRTSAIADAKAIPTRQH